MRRRLALRREVLADLSPADLTAVHGADAVQTVPVNYCLSGAISDRIQCDSLLRPCITHTCTR